MQTSFQTVKKRAQLQICKILLSGFHIHQQCIQMSYKSMFFSGALQRRRKVPFSKEKTLLILRAYELRPRSWTNLITDINKIDKYRIPQESPTRQN
jgi:hypothetical protein